MVQSTRTRIVAEDYFKLPEYAENDSIQLIDGEVFIGMPPLTRHQEIVGEIFYLLLTIAKKLGGKAFVAPTEVFLDEHNVYEPDVLYIKPDSHCTVGQKHIIGAPDLVVEVLSPSTAKYDREKKYRAYEKHGIAEYWIVDPIHTTVEVWIHDGKAFERVGAFADDDTFDSPQLAEIINVKTIFA